MLKILMVVVMMLFSVTAFSAEKKFVKRKIASEEIKCSATPNVGIGVDPDYIKNKVQAAQSCYEASHIVESCATGSTMDSLITTSAIDLCHKLTPKLDKIDTRLRVLMTDRCSISCDPQIDGTLCVSRQAFCMLDVAKFINLVTTPNN